MLKSLKHYVATIEGVNIYPAISLLVCFTFFVALFLWVYTYKNKDIDEMSKIPLKEDKNEDLL